jgi:outer membrane protein assembly factor BamB
MFARLVLGFVVAVLFAPAAPAQTMFRGDAAHSGIFAGPAAKGLSLLWEFKTGGAVIGSPVVANGTVYVGSGDGAVYALSQTDGRLLWHAKTGGEVNATPAIVADSVYVVSGDGALHALDTKSGHERWQFRSRGEHRFTKAGGVGLSPASEMMPDPWDFYLSSPAIANGIVYFGSGDNHVYAVDAQTGTLRWAFETGDVVHASPAIADGVVYIGSWDGRFYALDAATGRKLWDFVTGRDDAQHVMTGIPGSAGIADGRVVFGCRDAHVYALAARSGHLLWKYATDNGWVEASPALQAGHVYVTTSDSQQFLALDAATGRKIFALPTHIYVFSSPALADGHAYFGGFDGVVHDVDLTRQIYAAQFGTPDHADNAARWLDAKGTLRQDQIWTGATLDATIIGIRARLFSLGSILSSPAVDHGVVFVGSVNGTVYALH